MVVDNSQFAKEFLGEWNDPRKSRKSLGAAIGLPDEKDKEFLDKLIRKYKRQHPGWLELTTTGGRRIFEAGRYGSDRNETGTVNKDSGMTYDFELPPDFFRLIESHYPLMFRDKAHFHWWKRYFIEYMIRPNEKRRAKPSKS